LERSRMKKWTLIWVGFVTGLAFAGWSLFQEPRPAFCVFLQTPLTWLFNYIDSLRIYPRELLSTKMRFTIMPKFVRFNLITEYFFQPFWKTLKVRTAG
jgi:hypothetical protein